MAAVAGADVMRIGFYLNQRATGFQIRNERLAAGKAIQPLIFAPELVDVAVIGEHAQDGQPGAATNLKVIRVVTRRDLHRARAKLHFTVCIRHNRDFAPNHRYHDRLADQVLVTRVIRVDGNGRIAEHRLRAGRRHGDRIAAIRRIVADVPKRAGLFLILHFRIGKRSLAIWAPVDDPVALINKALVV